MDKVEKEKAASDHAGHRKRMKQRYAETGLLGFSDHNVLEMLLFYAVPRKDTNQLAHDLINRFGSYTAVMEASREELMQVDGITEHSATLINLVTQMNRRYFEQKSVEKVRIIDSNTAGEYFVGKFAYESNECAYAMLLDIKHHMITCQKISQGVVNGTSIDVRELCERALKFKASYVIVAHNHPSGVLMPSAEDESCTRMIKNALNVIGITLSDHILVAGGRYISFDRYGML